MLIRTGFHALGAAVLVFALPASAQWSYEWDRRPSLRYGKQFQMDFRVKLQTDFLAVDEDPEPARPAYDFRRKRVGVEGNFLKDFEYEFDVELDVERDAIRDAFVNYTRIKWVEIQGGKFRIPFGRDQNTGPMDLDFVNRSRVGALLAPGRDVGVMAHARVWKRRLHYQFGVFRHDGRIAQQADDRPGGDLTVAWRLRSQPDDWVKLPKVLRQLELGVAVARTDLPEGLAGLRGRTTFDNTFFPRFNVAGRRVRTGVEAEWSTGPIGAQAEYVQVRDQRKGQSVFAEDLPDLLSRGWYVAGMWVLTGEKKDGGVRPKKEFLRGGIGAVELAVRTEQIRYFGAESRGRELLQPRSANFPAIDNRAWTFGVNWYVNRHVKVQGNFIREDLNDLSFTGSPVENKLFWSRVARVQLVF